MGLQTEVEVLHPAGDLVMVWLIPWSKTQETSNLKVGDKIACLMQTRVALQQWTFKNRLWNLQTCLVKMREVIC